MAKLPWMKFFPADFLLDTQLLPLSIRGAWIDILCFLWRADPRGRLSYPLKTWALLLRCSEEECRDACNALHTHHICTVIFESNGDVTLASRRIERDEKVRAQTAKRVSRHRSNVACNADGNGPVTGRSQKQKLEAEARKKKKSMPLRADDDQSWIEDLKKNPAYQHINFAVEFGKMDAWFSIPKNKGRKRTKAFVLNWLNKIEAPMKPQEANSYRPTKVVL